MNDTLLWILSIALILVGLVGIVVPALPGVILVFAGIALGAWIDNFQRVGGWAVGAVAVLAVLALVVDFLSATLGARRVGASREAVIGAALGTVAGLFMGLVGVFFMPLVGAAAGEFLARRHHGQALRVGLATWIGMLLGTLAKAVLAFMMIGIFVLALLMP